MPACSIRGVIGEAVSAALTQFAASAITGGDQDVTRRQAVAIAACEIAGRRFASHWLVGTQGLIGHANAYTADALFEAGPRCVSPHQMNSQEEGNA